MFLEQWPEKNNLWVQTLKIGLRKNWEEIDNQIERLMNETDSLNRLLVLIQWKASKDYSQCILNCQLFLWPWACWRFSHNRRIPGFPFSNPAPPPRFFFPFVSTWITKFPKLFPRSFKILFHITAEV